MLLLGVLSAFGPFVVDLYLPFATTCYLFETSASMTQLTLTTAMIGLAVGQLLLVLSVTNLGEKFRLLFHW
ncbi:MAG: hypothetical protein ACLR5Y_00260 [Haemophilus parainfluenzae]